MKHLNMYIAQESQGLVAQIQHVKVQLTSARQDEHYRRMMLVTSPYLMCCYGACDHSEAWQWAPQYLEDWEKAFVKVGTLEKELARLQDELDNLVTL